MWLYYYTDECSYINNCIIEIKKVCEEENISLKLIHIDTLEKAKIHCDILIKRKFLTHELLNKGRFKKFLDIN